MNCASKKRAIMMNDYRKETNRLTNSIFAAILLFNTENNKTLFKLKADNYCELLNAHKKQKNDSYRYYILEHNNQLFFVMSYDNEECGIYDLQFHDLQSSKTINLSFSQNASHDHCIDHINLDDYFEFIKKVKNLVFSEPSRFSKVNIEKEMFYAKIKLNNKRYSAKYKELILAVNYDHAAYLAKEKAKDKIEEIEISNNGLFWGIKSIKIKQA